jgi:16S rRNA (cytidine1402-2'-O)-methyltransferase
MATLWIVATPIGNLEDISLRALNTLKAADCIACEDTRHTLKLLNRYEIQKPLLSCYAYREEKGAESVLRRLEAGENVAYVSDAGTPALSDPGALLVSRVRTAGHTILPIPGPSAFACLLSVAGLVGKSVVFEGFLSPKAGRRRSRLAELMERPDAAVFYESPYRILKLLSDIADIDGDRPVAIGREMTKIHEEYLSGSAKELLAELSGRKEQKGEFALIVAGNRSRLSRDEGQDGEEDEVPEPSDGGT